jgi:hypothetical protein
VRVDFAWKGKSVARDGAGKLLGQEKLDRVSRGVIPPLMTVFGAVVKPVDNGVMTVDTESVVTIDKLYSSG